MLKEVAEKRLAAIKAFTDLGSGFKIAMRDLEIRGEDEEKRVMIKCRSIAIISTISMKMNQR